MALLLWHQRINCKAREISAPRRENVFMWENIFSARRDLGRVQARSRLARKIYSHVNACDILCGKDI